MINKTQNGKNMKHKCHNKRGRNKLEYNGTKP